MDEICSDRCIHPRNRRYPRQVRRQRRPGCHQSLPGPVRSTVGNSRAREHWGRRSGHLPGRTGRRVLDVGRRLGGNGHQNDGSDAIHALPEYGGPGQSARRAHVCRQPRSRRDESRTQEPGTLDWLRFLPHADGIDRHWRQYVFRPGTWAT